MNNGRRVRRETGWRSLACSVCGPDTTHALIRSGLPRFRWFGPPAAEVRDYARCLVCGTQRGQEQAAPLSLPLSWTEAVRHSDGLPIGADPR
jgi:ribosomal protein S14